MNSKQLLDDIVLNGTPSEKRALYSFCHSDSTEVILKKFKYYARGMYPRYFQVPSPDCHDEIVTNLIITYMGRNEERPNYLDIAARGLAKTTIHKLFTAFVLHNDLDKRRMYMKVLTKDYKNSRQIVTDVYNLLVEGQSVYGDVFQKDKSIKREETMGSFTLGDGRKLAAGTVGQTQRGHIQDAYRPDLLWFDDVEDRESVRSMVITQSIMEKCDEAITGLSKDGAYTLTANYISDQGTVEWFKQKKNVRVTILPIADKDFNPTWPERDTREDIMSLKENSEDFWGEYMCDPKRSENKFFDIERIESDLQGCVAPTRESAGVKYWKDYLPHHRYGQGSDHSEGIGLDSNTLVGFDFTTGEQVYSYANNEISPDLAAHEFARVGAEYGNCKWAPEVNNECGGTVITTLRHISYPDIYTQERNKDKRLTSPGEKLGWSTNSKTKYTMIYEFRKDYNDGLIKIHDANILKEMKAFTNNDLTDTASGLITRHFDLLMAACIAWQMRKHAVPKDHSGQRWTYKDGKLVPR